MSKPTVTLITNKILKWFVSNNDTPINAFIVQKYMRKMVNAALFLDKEDITNVMTDNITNVIADKIYEGIKNIKNDHVFDYVYGMITMAIDIDKMTHMSNKSYVNPFESDVMSIPLKLPPTRETSEFDLPMTKLQNPFSTPYRMTKKTNPFDSVNIPSGMVLKPRKKYIALKTHNVKSSPNDSSYNRVLKGASVSANSIPLPKRKIHEVSKKTSVQYEPVLKKKQCVLKKKQTSVPKKKLSVPKKKLSIPKKKLSVPKKKLFLLKKNPHTVLKNVVMEKQ